MLSHIDIPGTAAKRITQIYSPLAAVAEEDPLWTLYGFTRPSWMAPWSSSSVVSYTLVSLVLGPSSPFPPPSDRVGAAIAVVMVRMKMRERMTMDRCGDLRCMLFCVRADTAVFT